jgi:hypothetical protein
VKCLKRLSQHPSIKNEGNTNDFRITCSVAKIGYMYLGSSEIEITIPEYTMARYFSYQHKSPLHLTKYFPFKIRSSLKFFQEGRKCRMNIIFLIYSGRNQAIPLSMRFTNFFLHINHSFGKMFLNNKE